MRTTSAEATERAGAELAATLEPGDVVLVSGELGAGKTTFVRGALRALGVTGPVTSPTFVVGVAYEGAARAHRRAAMQSRERVIERASVSPATFTARWLTAFTSSS